MYNSCIETKKYDGIGWCAWDSEYKEDRWGCCTPSCSNGIICFACFPSSLPRSQVNVGDRLDTLDECKSMCLDDPKCLAIEFGKEGEKFEGRCLLNSESVDFKNSSKVDAWIRTTDCGN